MMCNSLRSALHPRSLLLPCAVAGIAASAPAAHAEETPAAVSTESGKAKIDLGGWFAGAQTGYTVGRARASDGTAETSSTPRTLVGGLQVGYTRLLPSGFLLGIETATSVPNFRGNDDRVSLLTTTDAQTAERLDVTGALRARVGHTFALGSLYATGGLAWSVGHFVRSPAAGPPDAERWRFRPGWTVGAGFELPLARSWTARVDYAFGRLAHAEVSFSPGTSVASTVDLHSLTLGLSWHFGSRRDEPPRGDLLQAPESDVSDGASVQAVRPAAGEPVGAAIKSQSWNIHGQTTFVEQGYPGFHSPYEGPSSLSGRTQFRNTVSATAFLGIRAWPGGELYFNPEVMQGYGLSDVHGVAAFPNGEAQKSSFLFPRFNAARLYLTQTFNLGGTAEAVEDGPNQLAGVRKISRLTLSIGKFAVTDFFLLNAYAGEPRTGFLNWNIYGGGSYDWTMDLLSWTWGGLVELNQERWAFRAGYFLLPVQSSTNYFDTRIPNHGQYTAEFDLRHRLFGKAGKVQLFGWLSHGNIGSYVDALAEPASTPNYPDVALTRGQDRTNYGLVLSIEQAITEHSGLFSRASWSPEQVEAMGWTDCGQSFSLGTAVTGDLWRRPGDVLGLAGVIEGLSPVARRYFTAGGMGILIGDGRLNYAPEGVVEAYYRLDVLGRAAATVDYQLVVNPGYNADRGPVSIVALRLHAAF